MQDVRQALALERPDAKDRMYLVYLKYWTLNLMPLIVYPKVLFNPMYSIKAPAHLRGREGRHRQRRPKGLPSSSGEEAQLVKNVAEEAGQAALQP